MPSVAMAWSKSQLGHFLASQCQLLYGGCCHSNLYTGSRECPRKQHSAWYTDAVILSRSLAAGGRGGGMKTGLEAPGPSLSHRRRRWAGRAQAEPWGGISAVLLGQHRLHSSPPRGLMASAAGSSSHRSLCAEQETRPEESQGFA